jgi:hypothetical protein
MWRVFIQMRFTILDTSENDLGSIECEETCQMYVVRERVRSFFSQEDTDISVWKCTIYRKEGDHKRVIGDQENAKHQPLILYATIRELHGIKPTTNPYDYMKYWDEDCQYHEEAINYMTNHISEMIKRDFVIVDVFGDIILNVDNNIKHSLLLWINKEKNNNLLDPLEWKLWYYVQDIMHPTVYVGYHKLFRFKEEYYEFSIIMVECQCQDRDEYNNCSIHTTTEFRFVLVHYGHIDQNEIILRYNHRPIPLDDLITDKAWNILY